MVKVDPNEALPAPRGQVRRPMEYQEYVREEVLDRERLFEPKNNTILHPAMPVERSQDFTIEDFEKLVIKTYEEPDDPFPNVDQFVKAYHKYGLDKYSKYLSERNELNSVTSPSIDMEIEETCSAASKIVKETRGRVAVIELISYILVCGFIWLIIGASIALGVLTNFLWGVILFFIYLCIVGNFAFWSRRRSSRYLRISHFVLAVFCRIENNRFYLKKHVTLRPGYLAKWIEFCIDRRYIPEEVMKAKCKVELIDPDELRESDLPHENRRTGNRKREVNGPQEEEKRFYESESSFGRDENGEVSEGEGQDEVVLEVYPKE